MRSRSGVAKRGRLLKRRVRDKGTRGSAHQERLHVFGQGQREFERGSARGMCEPQVIGVKRLTPDAETGCVAGRQRVGAEPQEKGLVYAVKLVADDRVAEREQGGAELVQSPCAGMRPDHADSVAARLDKVEGRFGPVGGAHVRAVRLLRHKTAFLADNRGRVRLQPSGGLDMGGERAFDKNGVALHDMPCGELPGELLCGGPRFRNHNQSGGLAIQPIDQDRKSVV